MTLKELGDKDSHHCYACMDDWKFERKRCWQRQFEALLIKHLVATEGDK